ncbi:MAG: response regulator, partial [Bacteroidota bacterium]
MERLLNVLIIEDEKPAVRRMVQLIGEIAPEMTIQATLDSVTTAVDWLKKNPAPDLIFADIQLADGISFEIFTQVAVQSPVIFTTAYNQYTLRAFKLNSIDYLLKPIDPEELKSSIEKFKRLRAPVDTFQLQKIIQQLQPQSYKEPFLI